MSRMACDTWYSESLGGQRQEGWTADKEQEEATLATLAQILPKCILQNI